MIIEAGHLGPMSQHKQLTIYPGKLKGNSEIICYIIISVTVSLLWASIKICPWCQVFGLHHHQPLCLSVCRSMCLSSYNLCASLHVCLCLCLPVYHPYMLVCFCVPAGICLLVVFMVLRKISACNTLNSLQPPRFHDFPLLLNVRFLGVGVGWGLLGIKYQKVTPWIIWGKIYWRGPRFLRRYMEHLGESG